MSDINGIAGLRWRGGALRGETDGHRGVSDGHRGDAVPLWGDAACVVWTQKINALAAFTLIATGGDAAAIESAGFYVVRPPSSPVLPLAPESLKVATNGSPGVSKVTWKPVEDAKSYNIQSSPDPITATSWGDSVSCTKASHETTGAEPGKVCCFRVAALNGAGQGPWREPARRPVM